MGNNTTNGFSINSLYVLKKEAVNDLKVIYRSTITVDSTIQNLSTDLAAILAAGLGKPRAASFAITSTETSNPVARYTQEGTDPVAATTGKPMYNALDTVISEYYNLQRFKITEEAAGPTTTIEVTYYK